MSALDDLLVTKAPKRGILIEVSYQDYNKPKVKEFISKLKDKDLIGVIEFERDPISGRFIQVGEEEERDNNNKKEEEEEQRPLPFLRTTECEFFERLKNMWEVHADIVSNLERGNSVIIEGYVFDALLFAHSSDCFCVKTLRDQMAVITLLGFFKGLTQPDLVLSVVDSPSNIEAEFQKQATALNPNGEYEFDIDKEIIHSKMFQRENSRDLFSRVVDSTRTISPDVISISVSGMGAVLVTRIQDERTKRKIY